MNELDLDEVPGAPPDPKTWKPVDGATCLRCVKNALVRKRELGATESGAALVLSDRLVCPDCGWAHTLTAVKKIPQALMRIARARR